MFVPWDSFVTKRRLGLFVLALLPLGISIIWAQSSVAPQAPPATREGRWAQDLKVFSDGLSNGQKDFRKVYPADHFNSELAAVQDSISQLSDAEIILRLMRLVARAGIGHNQIRYPTGPMAFHRLPFTFYWFSDGLGVTAASQEHKEAIGARVVRIGSMTPEQLETAVAPYFSSETEVWLHQQSPTFMLTAELLQSLNLTAPDGTVAFTLAKADGKPFTLALSPVNWGDAGNLTKAADALQIPQPLSRKQPDSYYWYEMLPDRQTLYVQYNRCENDPKQPFADFVTKMFSSVGTQQIQRVIIDLRFNPGGNSNVINPLMSALKERRALSAPGHLYTLIGRLTFSSGLMAASNFRKDLHAILLGEPSGERPNGYGEVRELTLPNSKLVVRYTTKYFRLISGSDPPTFAPDIAVNVSLEDFLAGRDPVLDAALHHPIK